MNIFAKLGLVLVAASLPLSAACAAQPASPITKALVANVKANLDFLRDSGTLASARSERAAVRLYAESEQAEAVQTASVLKSTVPGSEAVEIASLAPRDSDALMTGRSVSIDVPTGGPAQAANGRAPLGEHDLAELQKLRGKKFDDAFWLKQLDALSQLRADYQAYIDDGDDLALVAMAKRELRQVERRLAHLTKI